MDKNKYIGGVDPISDEKIQSTGIIIKNPNLKIKYIVMDDTSFEDKHRAIDYEEKLSRYNYYNFLLAKRNWFMKFFNIKPSMKFYDELVFKSKSK